MANNIISLFKTLNEDMLSKLDIHNLLTSFYYREGNIEVPLELEDQEELYSFYMGRSKNFWDPNINNLVVERSFEINNSYFCIVEGDIFPFCVV